MSAQRIESVIIPQQLLDDLEKVARLLFPSEPDALIAGTVEGTTFHAQEIVLSPDEATKPVEDVGHYRRAQTFDELITLLGPHVQIIQLQRVREAEALFVDYKECQRRRHSRECCSAHPKGCATCPVTRLPYHKGFDWTVNESSPFLCWHSHPSSLHGDQNKVSIPSDTDTVEMLKLLESRRRGFATPVVGEMITVIFETWECVHRAFTLPELPPDIATTSEVFLTWDQHKDYLKREDLLLHVCG